MKIKLVLICFIVSFFIASCSIIYQNNSYGIKIIEEQSRTVINSYSTLDGPNATEGTPLIVYGKNNDFIDITITNSNASCNEFHYDRMKKFFDKATDNNPSLIKIKHKVNIHLLPFSKFNNKSILRNEGDVVYFYFPFPKCDDYDRLNTIYYLMIHELKHVDLILTGEDDRIDTLDNEFLATKSSNCTLINNKHFNSIDIFEVTSNDLKHLNVYKESGVGNTSQLGAMKFHYEASKVSGIGVIKIKTEQHKKLVRWCNE